MASWPMVYNSLPGYAGFTSFTPTIPKLYWDVYSQEERIKRICMELHKLCEYASALNVNINLNHDMIDALQAEFEKFKESGFIDYYVDLIEAWINEHMPDIIKQAIKMVYFGLTDNGYFCAYIPDSWSDITFDTGAVFGRSDYGRLILRFESDGAIDNTYSYSLAQSTNLEKLIADLETESKRTDATYDTLFTNLNEDVILNGNI